MARARKSFQLHPRMPFTAVQPSNPITPTPSTKSNPWLSRTYSGRNRIKAILLVLDFMATATAVARIGSCAADIAALERFGFEQGLQRDYAAHERQLKTVERAWLAKCPSFHFRAGARPGSPQRPHHPEAFISGITGTKTGGCPRARPRGRWLSPHETASVMGRRARHRSGNRDVGGA